MIVLTFLYLTIIILSSFLPKRIIYEQLGQAKLFNKNSEGQIEDLSSFNNLSDSLVFRLRQSIDLGDPNLREYEIHISELIAMNI
jgi:hypothetical protein